MKQQNKNTGKIGEQIAESFLVKKGYEILERNWGNKWGEVDLIVEKNKIIVFVEVKTKIGEDWGTPEEMINKHKLGKVRRMGEVYLLEHEVACRVDVVAVVLETDGSVKRVTHYENVY